jgi:hypothetical protein
VNCVNTFNEIAELAWAARRSWQSEPGALRPRLAPGMLSRGQHDYPME